MNRRFHDSFNWPHKYSGKKDKKSVSKYFMNRKHIIIYSLACYLVYEKGPVSKLFSTFSTCLLLTAFFRARNFHFCRSGDGQFSSKYVIYCLITNQVQTLIKFMKLNKKLLKNKSGDSEVMFHSNVHLLFFNFGFHLNFFQ